MWVTVGSSRRTMSASTSLILFLKDLIFVLKGSNQRVLKPQSSINKRRLKVIKKQNKPPQTTVKNIQQLWARKFSNESRKILWKLFYVVQAQWDKVQCFYTMGAKEKKKKRKRSKVDLRIIENAWIWQVGKITEYLLNITGNNFYEPRVVKFWEASSSKDIQRRRFFSTCSWASRTHIATKTLSCIDNFSPMLTPSILVLSAGFISFIILLKIFTSKYSVALFIVI